MRSIIKGRVGAFMASASVLVLTGSFLVYGHALTRGPKGQLEMFHASFSSANGLSSHAAVELGGVQVGQVKSIRLNPELALADVSFEIEKRLNISSDTAVAIGSSTMVGDNALQVIPGKSHTLLKAGSTITNAHPLMSLEQKISNYIFNTGKL